MHWSKNSLLSGIVRETDHMVRKIALKYNKGRRQWHPTPVLLPGKSQGWRSLEGCSPWDGWGSDTTEQLHFHFSLSCIGEGNDNPLQCSCLENPRDGGACWAAVYGVAQSQTWLKWLSSSSSNIGERVETVSDFIFWGSKITADGDCSHEIKRHSLEGKLWPT